MARAVAPRADEVERVAVLVPARGAGLLLGHDDFLAAVRFAGAFRVGLTVGRSSRPSSILSALPLAITPHFEHQSCGWDANFHAVYGSRSASLTPSG